MKWFKFYLEHCIGSLSKKPCYNHAPCSILSWIKVSDNFPENPLLYPKSKRQSGHHLRSSTNMIYVCLTVNTFNDLHDTSQHMLTLCLYQSLSSLFKRSINFLVTFHKKQIQSKITNWANVLIKKYGKKVQRLLNSEKGY